VWDVVYCTVQSIAEMTAFLFSLCDCALAGHSRMWRGPRVRNPVPLRASRPKAGAPEVAGSRHTESLFHMHNCTAVAPYSTGAIQCVAKYSSGITYNIVVGTEQQWHCAAGVPPVPPLSPAAFLPLSWVQVYWLCVAILLLAYAAAVGVSFQSQILWSRILSVRTPPLPPARPCVPQRTPYFHTPCPFQAPCSRL